MKIAILGDTHFGARNASPQFASYFNAFYKDIFIPYIRDNDIRTVFQLGDLFDSRKSTNHYALAEAKKNFFEELNCQFITLLGNHDIFYRESLSISSTELLLGEYGYIRCIGKPVTINIDGTKIDVVPWICKENHDEVVKFIKESKSDLLFGHFEIDGFSMYRGMAAHGGLNASMFEKYELVLSGHFHTKSSAGNITYVGTPYELTWQDAGDPRGFHIFDTETRKLTFIQNPYTIHYRFEYDEKNGKTIDLEQVKDKFVRIVVIDKSKDAAKFETFMTAVQSAGAYEVKVVEDMTAFKEGDIDESVDLEDTMTLMSSYVDSVETTADKDKIKTYMKTLYVESINIEE